MMTWMSSSILKCRLMLLRIIRCGFHPQAKTPYQPASVRDAYYDWGKKLPVYGQEESGPEQASLF
jgi:hypothetical protein